MIVTTHHSHPTFTYTHREMFQYQQQDQPQQHQQHMPFIHDHQRMIESQHVGHPNIDHPQEYEDFPQVHPKERRAFFMKPHHHHQGGTQQTTHPQQECHLLCGTQQTEQYQGGPRQKIEEEQPPRTTKSTIISNPHKRNHNIINVREDFIMETNYMNFYHKFYQALNCTFKPAFMTHRVYPTDQKKAAHYNMDVKFNKQMFELITKQIGVGSRRVCEEENAGGCSVFSEVMSCEIMTRLFDARLIKTEMEIAYIHDGSKKTDFLMMIDNKKVGISVTRAFKYKRPTEQDNGMFADFTVEDGMNLLKKKLSGISWANQNVQKQDNWEKHILHIFVPNKQVANALKQSYKTMNHNYKKNTIVIVTETTTMDCIYSERLYDHTC
ncbi:hypothetical protein FDP41_008680 [Naegleria fowleri]|uniref:Uncharacterized protein n=1 Tax=Naegleria fowleri TaxID=5763 RepID=A0A6A5BEK6_NAEFO|nr:uncharacterized protein FDP41_008680 [Naegleria fowleri]KAF0973016.1 hypothetical protein FDP41_008680 [Naegleria fowleri]